jgi:hypothetical protein
MRPNMPVEPSTHNARAIPLEELWEQWNRNAKSSPSVTKVTETDDQAELTFGQWQRWRAANEHYENCFRRQQSLQTELFDVAEFPQVYLLREDRDDYIVAQSDAEIDKWFGEGDLRAVARDAAKARLAAMKEEWQAADARVGYSRSKDAEETAEEAAQAAATALWSAPASSLPGVVCKLHALIESRDPLGILADQPWPILRMIFRDMLQLLNKS